MKTRAGACLMFLAGSVACGQTAQITGRIVDPTGAVVPSAQVNVLNVETGKPLPGGRGSVVG
jgi:hypothetical protein